MVKRLKKIKLPYNKIEKNGYNEEYVGGYFLVKYDYDSVYSGEYNYIEIVNGKIIEINQFLLYKIISGKLRIDNIRDYCLDRFIKKSFTSEVVSFVTIKGYYGSEPGYKIEDSFSESLNLMIDRLNNSNENEADLIEDILVLEYGYILPELKNKKWIFYNNLNLDQISPAAGMRHVQTNIVNEYKKQYEENKYNLTCLCAGYRLIDGYHRYSAANQLNLKTIDVISCN